MFPTSVINCWDFNCEINNPNAKNKRLDNSNKAADPNQQLIGIITSQKITPHENTSKIDNTKHNKTRHGKSCHR